MVHHMFLHALGFHHTQTRPDRDDFIDVNAEKVEELPGTLKKLIKKFNSLSEFDRKSEILLSKFEIQM